MLEIIITSFDKVEEILNSRNDIVAVLSIEHPNIKEGGIGAAPRISKVPQKILCFWDSEHPVDKGPDIGQVEEGLLFALKHIKKGSVIIHCKAGKARSTAMALGVISVINPRMNEKDLLERLLEIRPMAAPNIIIVDMIDRLSGRNGKLLKAVLNHKLIRKQREQAKKKRKNYIQKCNTIY